jgi:hypothetical protein
MKTQYDDIGYDILREEDGEWIWCGYGDSPDQGGVTVPQEVLDRIAEGRPGKLEVEGEGYWIKPSGPRRS